MSAFAAVLMLVAAASWLTARGARPSSRIYLHFACVLYVTLAASALAGIAPQAVGVIAATMATALLMLAAFASFRRAPKSLPAAAILAVTCIAGIWSAASGAMAPAVILQVVCQFVMIALARRGVASWHRESIYLALAAVALIAASCSLLVEDTRAFMVALLLFSAAGLQGTALALMVNSKILVEEPRGADSAAAVRRVR